jgi:hypothetical protein
MSPAPARPELAIASAAAHDLNEELTIVLASAALALEKLAPTHPARPLLIELQQAAQRCAWKTSGLLNYSARKGTRPVNVPMERLILGRR